MKKENKSKMSYIKGKATYLFTIVAFLCIVFSSTTKKNNNLKEGEQTNITIDELDILNTPDLFSISPNETPLSGPVEREMVFINEVQAESTVVAQGYNINEFIKYNSSSIGGLCIPGTTIYFPIVKSFDDEEWLNKNFSGKESMYGTIFLDFINSQDFSDKVSSLFGHNMNDYKMFTNLNKYLTDENYYHSHEYAFLSTKDLIHIYKFAFSSKVPSDNNEIRKGKYKKNDEYSEYVDLLESYQVVKNPETNIDNSEKLLQLLTCCGTKKYRTAVYFEYQYSLPNVLSKYNVEQNNLRLINDITSKKGNYSELSQNQISYFIDYSMNYTIIETQTGEIFTWTASELGETEKQEFVNKYGVKNFIYGLGNFELDGIFINIIKNKNGYILLSKENELLNVKNGLYNVNYVEKQGLPLKLLPKN